MKDGVALSSDGVTKALKAKGLEFVSKSVVAEDDPAVVYVLNVAGVG